jgi:transcription initiation factor TFIID subunit 10
MVLLLPRTPITARQTTRTKKFRISPMEEDMARRDRTLAEFLVLLDGYKPLVRLLLAKSWSVVADFQIPEEVTEYYLQRSGFDCSDPRL